MTAAHLILVWQEWTTSTCCAHPPARETSGPQPAGHPGYRSEFGPSASYYAPEVAVGRPVQASRFISQP